MKMRYISCCIVLLALVITGCGAKAVVPQSASTQDVLAMLPDTIAGVQSAYGITDHESGAKGAGYSKKYLSQEPYKNITVYSYTLNITEIPTGIDSEIFQEVFAASADAVVQYASEELMELDMGEVNIREMPFMFAAYAMPQQKALTYIFMTGFNGTFVKVRYDHPFVVGGDEETNIAHMMAVKTFMEELVLHLQESTGTVGEISESWL
jgi:hypothetical protein